MKKKRSLYAYYVILPALLIYVAFFIAPSLYGVVYSLTAWTIGKPSVNFVGLKNYVKIFQDSELRKAIGNTFLYTAVVVVFKNLFGLLLALAFNLKLRTKNYLRAVTFLPCILSSVVIGLIFVPILHPNGFLNTFLESAGLGFLTQSWLTDVHLVMFSIAGVSIWQWTGYHMVIYLAGLQGIAREYYEASLIDGAGAFQQLRKSYLPLLAPSLNINFILTMIGGLKVFSEPYALTGGGPGSASQVIALEVFEKFGRGEWGLGTALNVILMLFVIVICVPLLLEMRKREVEE